MTLRALIEADLKKAMLEKNELVRDTLRMAKADLLNEEVKLGRDLTDQESQDIVKRGVKSRRDSIESYKAGNNDEAAAKEEQEIGVLERYLPKALSEDETRAAIQALIVEHSLSGKKDLGRLMKELKAKHPNVDGKIASTLAPSLLEG